jgi:hypothetical protein
MMERTLTVPEIALLAGTRAFLGIGIGLLISGRLTDEQRKAAGLALTLVGVITAIPLALGIISEKSGSDGQIKQVA